MESERGELKGENDRGIKAQGGNVGEGAATGEARERGIS